MRIIRKFIGFSVMYWGVAWWVAGAAAFFMLFDDPEFTMWKKIGIALLAGIMGFVCFYTGRWIWKDDKKPKARNVQAFDLTAGGTGQTGAPFNGTAFTGATNSGNGKRGRTVPFHASSTPGAGGEAAPNEPVTVDCPGCGAPVSVSPSSAGECEYCGNKVQYGRPR